ncbi:ParB/RepB/Spo0J family partition protein [Actinosynnema sp. CS-041913]|uniref:ParB/RepB/Spo0J family partition protein n=1 Tax=Actinosynnema sp. CS-041913 TaxID=3239917 RepID=UPI003D8F326F
MEVENPALCASIRAHGVRVPIIVNPAEDGGYRVRDGHCRTLIAIPLVDRYPVVPAIVTGSEDEEQWAWLRDQWVANEVRSGYTTADTIRIFEQMTLFGLSPQDVATELSVDVATVKAGLTARRSTAVARTLKDFPQLSLAHAAELAAFEDDEQVYQALVNTLADDPEAFDHELAEWQLEFRLREEREELSRTLRESGVAVVGDVLPVGTQRLDRLYRSDKNRTRMDDPAAHASCPGHAAMVTTDNAEGAATAVYVCREWAKHGHVDVWSVRSSAAPEPWTGEKSAARARVVRNNKAWRAAETARHKKLRELLARRTPPRLAGQFIAHSLVAGGQELRRAMERRHRLACTLLGLKEPQYGKPHPLADRLRKANANQATMISLAVLLAAFEASTGTETWRSPTEEQKRYFAALADWGVRLHWVERLVNDPAADAGVGVEVDLTADPGGSTDTEPAPQIPRAG